jgi:hydrogenase nickel incorporation protein HypA/HybF
MRCRSPRACARSSARAHGARRVGVVRLEIGRLSQVEVEAMRFAFEVVQRGTVAEGARLEIVETDGTAWCLRCSAPVVIARRGDPCPVCQSWQLQVTGGDRMRVIDIQIE